MADASLSSDLDWWTAHRAGGADRTAMAETLARLRAWKATHDQDRAGQPGPFLKMAWDAVFGDENGRVEAAISELEAALAAS